jgi:hypothetical protein
MQTPLPRVPVAPLPRGARGWLRPTRLLLASSSSPGTSATPAATDSPPVVVEAKLKKTAKTAKKTKKTAKKTKKTAKKKSRGQVVKLRRKLRMVTRHLGTRRLINALRLCCATPAIPADRVVVELAIVSTHAPQSMTTRIIGDFVCKTFTTQRGTTDRSLVFPLEQNTREAPGTGSSPPSKTTSS